VSQDVTLIISPMEDSRFRGAFVVTNGES
jgi:hypothetical protein